MLDNSRVNEANLRRLQSSPETERAQPFPCDSWEGSMLVYALSLIYQLPMRSHQSEIQFMAVDP